MTGGSVVPGPNTNQCTVNVAGITTPQTLNFELDNVVDAFGGTGNVSVSMGVLVGDTNADRFVDSIDTAQTKSQAGQTLTQSNFREDVNVDGFIDAIDVALVKSKSGSVLNSVPPSRNRDRRN
jgi:Dockerin type I domain